jgi:hypothetical protein
MKTTTTLSTTNGTFTTAQQFASWVSARLGRSQVMKLNKRNGSQRLDMLMHEIVMFSKCDEIAFEYNNAAYGLQWCINSGRCNGETVLAIRAMNCRQLSMLVHELMTKCDNIGEYARYLMNKQQKGKFAKSAVKKAPKANVVETEATPAPVAQETTPAPAKPVNAKPVSRGKYNASVFCKVNGKLSGVFCAEVNEHGKMLRSNFAQCTGYEGTEAYDTYLRLRFPNEEYVILLDNCQGYKSAIYA